MLHFNKIIICALFVVVGFSCTGEEPSNQLDISVQGLTQNECAFLNSQELVITAQICDATNEAEGTRCDSTGFCQGSGEKKILDGDTVKFILDCPEIPYSKSSNVMVFYSYTGIEKYRGIGEHSCATYVSSQSSAHLKTILKGLCLAIGFDTIHLNQSEKNRFSLQQSKFITNFYEEGFQTTNIERVCNGDFQ